MTCGVSCSGSQEELAVFVGAPRESVNRQLQTWKRRGLIELGHSRIRLVDTIGLAAGTGDIGRMISIPSRTKGDGDLVRYPPLATRATEP
jgi:hypothetical protein